MDRVWTLRDVLRYWVSPWQQPQARKATREHELVRVSWPGVPTRRANYLKQVL
jgi:hypothetical protein